MQIFLHFCGGEGETQHDFLRALRPLFNKIKILCCTESLSMQICLTMMFLELPKFTKRIDELDGNILDGMYFCFKNMTTLETRPEVLNHQVFARIFEVSELYNMDQYTRDKVLQKMTTERDLRNQMAYAMQEATAEGLEKGLVEGRAEGIVMVARNMLHQGIGVDVISTCTGLSASEIELL